MNEPIESVRVEEIVEVICLLGPDETLPIDLSYPSHEMIFPL